MVTRNLRGICSVSIYSVYCTRDSRINQATYRTQKVAEIFC